MTVKELMEKTTARVIIAENNDKFPVNPWNMIYSSFCDCVIDNIEIGEDALSFEITLKKELVRG